ncbi:MAG: hypothetical protein U9R15_01705 [Chloroflexota bacterium]|nr:hypothetical protein [Chloroflexota bacterium]
MRVITLTSDILVIIGLNLVDQTALTITKSVTPTADVALGGAVTYTIVVANSGNADATGVVVTDTLEPGVIGSDLNWTGVVTAGEQVEFTIAAVITTSTDFYGLVITNTAYFSHASSNGSDDAVFTIEDLNRIYLPLVMRNAS